jgi:hypothetical protein
VTRLITLLLAVGCLTAAGCSDTPTVSPTAPAFVQPDAPKQAAKKSAPE